MLFGKVLGFLLGIVFLVLIIGSLLTGTLHENFLFIIMLLILNVCLALILPRVFPTIKIVLSIGVGMETVGKVTNKVIVSVALFFVYILGIGPIWLISRLTGKKFLKLKSGKKSSWVNTKKKNYDFEEMF